MSNTSKKADWSKPSAMALPKGGYFPNRVEQGRYGPVFPRTPANYGFTIIAKIIPGREPAFYEYAQKIEKAVAETPDPDSTLVNLEQVTASLGAKAVLWELFSFLPASLKLYVDICSNSSFLSQILINNPGMIDDLLELLGSVPSLVGIAKVDKAARSLRAG